MLDLHNHVLFGLDDGCRTLEESEALCAAAKAAGHTGFVATPHIRAGMFDNDPEGIRARRDETRATVEAAGLELHLGAEYYFDAELLPAAQAKRLLTLGETSRYVLTEMPSRGLPPRYDEVLYELSVVGYVPIVAHPERCAGVQADIPRALRAFRDAGALLQLDLGSLVGHYGRSAKKAAVELVKLRAYHVAAGDLHRPGDVSKIIPPARTALTKLLKKRQAADQLSVLLCDNPRRIVADASPEEVVAV